MWELLCAVDVSSVLVNGAKSVGRGVADGVVQAIVSAGGVVLVTHGSRRLIRWVKEQRPPKVPVGQQSLPSPVGSGRPRPGYQPVTSHGRSYASSYGGRNTRSSMIGRKRLAAERGGYQPSGLGYGESSWDSWEVRERREAAAQLRATRAYRRSRAKPGSIYS